MGKSPPQAGALQIAEYSEPSHAPVGPVQRSLKKSALVSLLARERLSGGDCGGEDPPLRKRQRPLDRTPLLGSERPEFTRQAMGQPS